MRRALTLICAVAAAAATAATVGGALPPPGATAQCRDGTYSYSQHHSGTCSHHGGVSAWLDGAATSGGATTSAGSGFFVQAGKADVGKTVLLKKRMKMSGCTVGALPDRRCSPGAYYSKLTKTVICSSGFRTSTIRNVPESEKFAVEREYGLVPKHYGSTLEIDHIVSLELGGSNDIADLFPEEATPSPGYHV